jgi:hypothetical protein
MNDTGGKMMPAAAPRMDRSNWRRYRRKAGLKTGLMLSRYVITTIADAYFPKHGYSRDSRRHINLQNTFNATKLNHKIWKRPLISIINRGHTRFWLWLT